MQRSVGIKGVVFTNKLTTNTDNNLCIYTLILYTDFLFLFMLQCPVLDSLVQKRQGSPVEGQKHDKDPGASPT